MEKLKILLVEDEEHLAKGLEYNLTEEGYEVNWAKDGNEAINKIDSNTYDLILLDIMLPYLNGFEIAEHVRKDNPQLPILMLTAKTTDKDKIKGLEAGADDYITKPFNLDELILRVKGMLKRKEWYKKTSENIPVYKIGRTEVNFDNLICVSAKSKFSLTQQEAMVLKYMIDNKGKVISRKELLEKVWNTNPNVETRTVDNFIARLRKYFEPEPSKPIYFKSVRSAGYIFED